MGCRHLIGKIKNKKNNDSKIEEYLIIVESVENKENSTTYSCRNCTKTIEQSKIIQSENGDIYCSMECEEKAIIQDVYEVNKVKNLEEHYFE